MIFELMETNLSQLINEQQLTEPDALLLIYQLLKAVSFVHSFGIICDDISPENCLINLETLELKLNHFCSHGTSSESTLNQLWYSAPESIISKNPIGKSADLWAVGCILFELLTGVRLFQGENEADHLNQIHQICGTPSQALLRKIQQNNPSKISLDFQKI